MNMEVNGATETPMELSIPIAGENHENAIDKLESGLKFNGTESDVPNEVGSDLIKLTFDLEKDNEIKNIDTSNSLVTNNTSEKMDNESVDSPSEQKQKETVDPLGNDDSNENEYIDSPSEHINTEAVNTLGIDENSENTYDMDSSSEQAKLQTSDSLGINDSSENTNHDFIGSPSEQRSRDEEQTLDAEINNSSENTNIDSPPEQKNMEAGDPLASNDSSENFNNESVDSSSDQKEMETIDINESSENVNNEFNESPSQHKKMDNSDPLEINDETEIINNTPDKSSTLNDKEVSIVSNKAKQNSVIDEPKPVEKMQLRRSSRGIKRKRYDDEGPDIEEVKAVNKNKTSNKQSIQKQFSNSSANIPNLYQRVLGPNTTLTPISAKNRIVNVKNVHNTAQPAILPSLTDDMFVVEAPSFIVPYVYEKPPVEPLKEYVEALGKQIIEEKAKLEELKKDEDSQSSDKTNGQEADETEGDIKSITNLEEMIYGESETKKGAKRDRRRKNNPDDDDKSWDGESSSDSLEEIEEKDVKMTSSTTNKINKLPYFDLTLGKFFSDIGLNLVTQFVQNDLLKQQKKKLSKERRAGHTTRATEMSVLALKKNIALSEKKNTPFLFEQERKCSHCPFKSESMLVLSQHLETPHMSNNNIYKCNYCKFEIRSAHDMLCHMEMVHSIRTKLEKAPPHNSCPNCPYEDHGKGKLARHQIACAKRFKPDLNLAPPFEWEPPAKILTARAKTPMINPYQYNMNRQQMVNNNIGKPILNNMMPGVTNMRVRLRAPIPIPRSNTVSGISILRGGATIRPSVSSTAIMQPNIPGGSKPKVSHPPSISITPLPKQAQIQQRLIAQQSKNACVICEICDGYIKDLEQLRSHMQWIHRVKIHPKMMTNQPPLNCQKCQLRFFTDQGLERHLLGSHGLVTKSMQEEANKGNDGGRCPICGRVYQWKLLDHVGRDHKMTLKPAHLSYKCTVCSAIFGLYKQFENHVYSAHSVVAKRVMNKGKNLSQSKVGNTILKPLRDREDLTITTTSSKNIVTLDDDK